MTAATGTTPASEPTFPGPFSARSDRRPSSWSKARRERQRRRHSAEQLRHDRQPTTDAYIDRHGKFGIDARSFAAFFGR